MENRTPPSPGRGVRATQLPGFGLPSVARGQRPGIYMPRHCRALLLAVADRSIFISHSAPPLVGGSWVPRNERRSSFGGWFPLVRAAARMTPAISMIGVPRSPPAVALASSSPFGDRRKAARLCCRPAAACGGKDEHQPLPSMAAVPASLRAIQAKRKLAAAQRGVPRASAAGCAVAALVAAVEAVQGAAVGGATGAARGAGDAMAWVFSKVHLESPDLAVGLLGLVASCLGTAVEMEMERVRAKGAEASASKAEPHDEDDDDDGGTDTDGADDVPELVGLNVERELWSRIGILHGDDDDDKPLGVNDDEQEAIDIARAARRKAAYERIIATAEANSLILSNYAQLLYQFDKDLDRAEDYFKRAVAIEPPDGEAMRRYAMFLWHARGDLAGAEDMLTGAIDQEPESTHHRSSYAWFLWMTGGVETCVIDAGSSNDAAE